MKGLFKPNLSTVPLTQEIDLPASLRLLQLHIFFFFFPRQIYVTSAASSSGKQVHFGTSSCCKIKTEPTAPRGRGITEGVQEGRKWVIKQVKAEPPKPRMHCCPLRPRPLLVCHVGNWICFYFFFPSSHFLKLLTNDFCS